MAEVVWVKEAFFFSEKQLFGIYYPSVDALSERLVVICPPFFDEYQRTYRALAEIADALSQKGWHVLRFDYHGTGESFGELEQIKSSDEWLDDIDLAIEEGLALSGASDVTLIGVRFGGCLAALASHENISQRFLWDPMVSGDEFLEHVRFTSNWLSNMLKENADYTCSELSDSKPEMFTLSPSLKESLTKKNLQGQSVSDCVVLRSRGTKELPKFDVKQELLTDFEYDWPAFEEGLLRPRLIQELLIEQVDG